MKRRETDLGINQVPKYSPQSGTHKEIHRVGYRKEGGGRRCTFTFMRFYKLWIVKGPQVSQVHPSLNPVAPGSGPWRDCLEMQPSPPAITL